MTYHDAYLINGSFEQTISALDRGLAYGDGVFRTMQIRDGQPVNWPLHYQKLVADCAVIGIVCPSAELLMLDLQHLFKLSECSNQKMEVAKIIVTRGEGARGYAPPAVTVPTRVIIKSAMPHYAVGNYEQGVSLHVCETRLGTQPKLAGIKHLNRLENILARMEWRDESLFDGLMLDQQDNVIECTSSNIFVRYGDQLVTPSLHQCGVAGITRQRILWLENALSLTQQIKKMQIKALTLAQLLQADEVVICNSLYGVFQVNTINDKSWVQQKLASTLRNLLGHNQHQYD